MSNGRIRIGIDARMYGADQTGIGRYIAHITEELFRMDQVNHYRLFLLPHEYERYEAPNARVKKVKVTEPWYGPQEQISLPLRFLRERVDILHVPHFNAPIFYPGKLIVTIHDATQLYFPGPKSISQPLRRFAYNMVFGAAVRNASKVIAVSHFTKNEILNHFSVPEEKIEVIYEGLPSLAKREAQIANRSDEGNALRLALSDMPYILYVGVWRPHKNIVRLLEAFSILKKDPYFGSLKLVLAGKEDLRYPEVRESIARLGLASHVHMPGFMADEELANQYSHASAVVIPSLVEGFGFVGLEALHYGVPVAASRTGSLPEVLGEAALYFDPLDSSDIAGKIKSILTDEEVRGRLQDAAPQALSRYSWKEAAQKTFALYRDMIHAGTKQNAVL